MKSCELWYDEEEKETKESLNANLHTSKVVC